MSSGGIAIRWAGDVFGVDHDGQAGGDAELLELAGTVPAGSDGLVMLPYLLAERAPLWDPTLSGAFLGVRYAHTRGHFVRAVIEGVALQLRAVVDDLVDVAPVTFVRATGGVFRERVWREVMAGVLDRPLSVGGASEGSALGAAALGLVALGRSVSLGQALDGLSPGLRQGGPLVEVAESDRQAYARTRESLPRLLKSYRAVGEPFAPA